LFSVARTICQESFGYVNSYFPWNVLSWYSASVLVTRTSLSVQFVLNLYFVKLCHFYPHLLTAETRHHCGEQFYYFSAVTNFFVFFLFFVVFFFFFFFFFLVTYNCLKTAQFWLPCHDLIISQYSNYQVSYPFCVLILLVRAEKCDWC
jgi:hypothetical protein